MSRIELTSSGLLSLSPFDAELEILKSIYEDDIVIEKENKQVSIQLSPHSQVVILITFSYLNKEYGKEIPDFTLRVIKGNVHPAYQNFFKQFLETEARNRLGQPMIFDLIEKLRVELTERDLTLSSINLLSNEILSYIFEFLHPFDLVTVSRVSKFWYFVVRNLSIWKTLYMEKFVNNDVKGLKGPSFIPNSENVNWFNLFWKTEHEYLKKWSNGCTSAFSVHHWVGCEDPFQNQTTSWYEMVNKLLQKKYFGFVDSYPSSKLLFSVGEFHFLSIEDAKYWFPLNKLLHTAMKPDCPYVGKLLGFLLFGPRSNTERLTSIIARICRGYVTSLASPQNIVCSIAMTTMRIGIRSNPSEKASDRKSKSRKKNSAYSSDQQRNSTTCEEETQVEFFVDKEDYPYIYLLSKDPRSPYGQHLQKICGRLWNSKFTKEVTFWAVNCNVIIHNIEFVPISTFDSLIEKLLNEQQQKQQQQQTTNNNNNNNNNEQHNRNNSK